MVEKVAGTAAGDDTIKDLGARRNLIEADEPPEKKMKACATTKRCIRNTSFDIYATSASVQCVGNA